eukprot:gene9128-18908_t
MIGVVSFLCYALTIVSVSGFSPSVRCFGRQSCLFSEASGSPLPTFDDIVKEPKRSEPMTPVAESPLVERALDSALDFLQDSETEAEEEEDDEFEMFEIYEESPDFEINYDLIKQYETKEAEALANKATPASEIFAAKVKLSVEKWRKHDKDVGSAEVQIAILNERVRYLTSHLLKNKFDKAAKRGLDTLVTNRRVMLNYLYETNRPKAEEMIKELGIRYRAPGRLWDKDAKYAAFKNTKSKFMKLRLIAKQERDSRAKAKAAAAAAVAI